MNELVNNQNGQPVTNSLRVVKKFKKRHDHVIRDIRKLITAHPKIGGSSFDKGDQLYVLNSYIDDSGKENPMFIMNKDGFTLLVMGFTGKEAIKFKLDFIDAFNQMEKAIASLVNNQLKIAHDIIKNRFIKSSRIQEIDITINSLLKERKGLIRDINKIDRLDFLQLSFSFVEAEKSNPLNFNAINKL